MSRFIAAFLILFAAVLFGLHGRVSAAVALRRGTEARTRGWWWAAVLKPCSPPSGRLPPRPKASSRPSGWEPRMPC